MIDGSSDSMESPPGQDPEGAQPPILAVSEMLTPSELEQLERTATELADSAKKAFPGLKVL